MLDDISQAKINRQRKRRTKNESDAAHSLCDVMLGLIASATLGSGQGEMSSAEEIFLKSCLVKFSGSNDWLDTLSEVMKNPSHKDIRLLALAAQLGLTEIEVLVTALALGVEQDAMIGRCITYVQSPIGGSRPSFGLLDTILTPIKFEPFNIGSYLVSGIAVRSGLLRVLNENAPLPEQSVKLAVPIAIALQGLRSNWPGGNYSLDKSLILPESIIAEAKKQGLPLQNRSNRVLVLRAGSLIEAQSIARAISNMLSREPLFLPKSSLTLEGLGPFCFLQNLIPVIQYELAPTEHEIIPQIVGYNGPVLVVSGIDGSFEFPTGSVANWVIPNPDYHERLTLWNAYLPNNDNIQPIARQHLYGAARISELAGVAQRIAESQQRQIPEKEDLEFAAFVNEGAGLGALAQLIQDKVPDDALVLSENVKAEIELLLARCRHRETLTENLGVTIKARYQTGVRSLMVGPSGTGKTLAASWLATRLNLPLYRVDLASVSSKYIGETEKNLSQLLSKAEQEEVVLLFDEADSMFGKRTDIQDSNDRFANAQTNYLLQRIESYTGIVLMTSNSRARFDSAFSRRIDMIIEFQIPKPEERRDLWRCHLGNNHELSNAKLNRLSAIAELCGGHIRNAVLTASILAVKENRSVEYRDLQQGIKSEYKKLGKKIPVELMK